MTGADTCHTTRVISDPIARVVSRSSGPDRAASAPGCRLLERGHHDFVILEKAPGIGGTWWHNRYPGAECDIKSHLYSFSFAPNPAWSRTYARQPEIKAYLEECVERFGLGPHLRLGTEVHAVALERRPTRSGGSPWATTARSSRPTS